MSGVHGAAAAYGLEVKHDLTITAADIFVAAKAGQSNRYSSESRVDTDAAKGNDVVAVGLQADNSNVSFTGASLKVEAINKGIKTKNVDTTGKEKLSAGGDAEVYGIRVNGGEVTATLTGELLMDNAWAANGAGSTYTFAGGTGGKGSAEGGDGGYAAACGIEVNGGGIAHLDLQDINTQDNMSSTYFSGGAGGAGAAAAANGVSGSGGKGGDVAVTGVHVASGKADGSIGAIKLRFSSGAEGGIGGVGKDGVGNCGSGGDAGAAYAAGVRVDGGEAELTVASMDINVKAAAGGNIGALEINDINKITATGTVQAAAGKGGTALAVGVDNRGGSSNVTATGDIKIAATGGTGGAGAKGKAYQYNRERFGNIGGRKSKRRRRRGDSCWFAEYGRQPDGRCTEAGDNSHRRIWRSRHELLWRGQRRRGKGWRCGRLWHQCFRRVSRKFDGGRNHSAGYRRYQLRLG